MQIVIKIPNDLVDGIKTSDFDTARMAVRNYQATIADAIKNGVQLPKEHGRLIDADSLIEYCQNGINKTVDCNDIARFPAIIKADKGRER